MKEKIYRIHPNIGFARVGNADAKEHFVGPTIPMANESHHTKAYKDQFQTQYKKNGKVRPQAALFTIWEYEKDTNTPIREIVLGADKIEAIGWQVHLVNKKADFFKFAGTYGQVSANPEGKRNDDKKNWIMDPLPRKISGPNQGYKDSFRFKKGTSEDPSKEKWIDGQPEEHQYLGELLTDEKGRLKIIGGKGIAATVIKKSKLTDAFNNPGWYDDVSDGLVQASITIKKFRKSEVVNAIPSWVMIGPPDFVPEIRQVVTLYDLLADMAVRNKEFMDHPILGLYPHLKEISKDFKADSSRTVLRSYKPHFHDDIYPILINAYSARFLHKEAYEHHGSMDVSSEDMVNSLNNNTAGYKPLRSRIFDKIRKPYIEGKPLDPDIEKEMKLVYDNKKNKFKKINLKDAAVTEVIKMPLLFAETYGVEDRPFLTLTPTQYQILKRWVDGDFIVSKNYTKVDNPIALDIASMENALGGGFYPGIDYSWSIKYTTNYSEPFRVDPNNKDGYAGGGSEKISPGYFSRQMGEPWHTDFTSCAKNDDNFFGFWPSQRPDDVLVKGNMTPWFRNDKIKKGWALMIWSINGINLVLSEKMILPMNMSKQSEAA